MALPFGPGAVVDIFVRSRSEQDVAPHWLPHWESEFHPIIDDEEAYRQWVKYAVRLVREDLVLLAEPEEERWWQPYFGDDDAGALVRDAYRVVRHLHTTKRWPAPPEEPSRQFRFYDESREAADELKKVLGWIETHAAQSAVSSDEPPAVPKKYLTSWREILIGLGFTNNAQDRERVRNLNEQYDGPIVIPKQGAQPKVEHTKLVEWWNGLEAQWTVGHNPGRDAKPTVARQHKYGKGGTVVPDISGGVKKRRRSPKG
jgi:hypothetical protein